MDELTFILPSLLQGGRRVDDCCRFRRLFENDGLWAAANTTTPSSLGSLRLHPAALELLLTRRAQDCAPYIVNMTNTGGVATLPTPTAADDEGSVFLMKVYGLDYQWLRVRTAVRRSRAVLCVGALLLTKGRYAKHLRRIIL